jgi:hypothetical protein
MRGFAVRGASGGSNYLFNNARFKGDNQPASRRRDCLRFVQVLIRFCGCGWLKGVGQGKADRVLSDFRLHYLFGEQFGADGNHFLNPDVNKLMCALIHRTRTRAGIAPPADGTHRMQIVRGGTAQRAGQQARGDHAAAGCRLHSR